MTRWQKIRLGWKYRKLLRHRKAILAGAICAGVVAIVVIAAVKTGAARTGSCSS